MKPLETFANGHITVVTDDGCRFEATLRDGDTLVRWEDASIDALYRQRRCLLHGISGVAGFIHFLESHILQRDQAFHERTGVGFSNLEQRLAYEQASGTIDGCTGPAPLDDHTEKLWHDLSDADIDISDHAAYLDSRRLLERHPLNPQWVRILDEDKPLPVAEGRVQ